jgi:hypothetical protein
LPHPSQEATGLRHISVGELVSGALPCPLYVEPRRFTASAGCALQAKREGCFEAYDEEYDTHILDEDKVR